MPTSLLLVVLESVWYFLTSNRSVSVLRSWFWTQMAYVFAYYLLGILSVTLGWRGRVSIVWRGDHASDAPLLLIAGDCREPLFSGLMLEELGKERVVLLLHGSLCSGKATQGYLAGFPAGVFFGSSDRIQEINLNRSFISVIVEIR